MVSHCRYKKSQSDAETIIEMIKKPAAQYPKNTVSDTDAIKTSTGHLCRVSQPCEAFCALADIGSGS